MVLQTAKDALGEETLSEIEKKLPPDWAEILENVYLLITGSFQLTN